MPHLNKPSRIKRWRPIGLKIAFAAAIIAVLIGFRLCYASTVPFLCWVASTVAVAFALRRRLRRFSISLFVLGLGGLLLWPIDAFLSFPVLRGLHSMVPFGPDITVFPSPSGHCVAYVYNHSFLDSAYEVRFAHALAFPGDRHWVPFGTLADARIEPRWDSGTFTVDVSGLGITLLYDERTRTITLPKSRP